MSVYRKTCLSVFFSLVACWNIEAFPLHLINKARCQVVIATFHKCYVLWKSDHERNARAILTIGELSVLRLPFPGLWRYKKLFLCRLCHLDSCIKHHYLETRILMKLPFSISQRTNTFRYLDIMETFKSWHLSVGLNWEKALILHSWAVSWFDKPTPAVVLATKTHLCLNILMASRVTLPIF